MRERKSLFPGQQDNETIHLVIWQHWVVIGVQMLVWLLFVGIFIGLEYFYRNYLAANLDPQYLPIVQMAEVAYSMFLALGFFIISTLYYLNIHVITNQRIVDIDQPGLLQHVVAELHLNQIQDVTAEIQGLMENVFNYGDVYVQTAGETERFIFSKIPNPTAVTKLILDLYEKLPEQEKHSQLFRK